jgi:hypothetical protein
LNNKVGRNRPCPCGSGKKYKYCCINKKDRNNAIVFDMGELSTITSISFDNISGQIKLFNNQNELTPSSIYQQTFYNRDSGKEKILNQIKLDEAKFNNELIHLQKFDLIYAVDTNTKHIKGDNISACTIIRAEFDQNIINAITCNFQIIDTLYASNVQIFTEEKQALIEVIRKISSDLNYQNNLKIALITDHDLGNLNKYNTQELALFGDFFLPSNFELLYASADVGKENILNILISECDKESSRFLKQFADKLL